MTIGKVSEISFVEFSRVEDYENWAHKNGEKEIVEIKFWADGSGFTLAVK